MTSVSQQTQPTSQASNSSSASQSTPSYASTAKKAVSSPPIATGSSSSPAVAVGGSAPVQQHGKSSSISPVNGRSSIPPAVPAVSAPAIAHGSSVNGGSNNHNRKASVTIANGPNSYGANGGPVGGSKGGIQFGSITDSPAASHSTPQIAQSTGSAPIAIPGNNPRVASPAQSPSPIPQPAASGGRPPSGLTQQGNSVTFGSLGGDGDVSFTNPLYFILRVLIYCSVTCDKPLETKALWLRATSLHTFVENPHNLHTAI
jgi:translation initiation factor 4G